MAEKNIIEDEKQIVENLYKSIVPVIEQAKYKAATAINSALLLRNWYVGNLIENKVLSGKKAGYGHGIIKSLAEMLTLRYGNGFDRSNLFRMTKFARYYTEEEKVVTLSPFLTWSHIVKLVAVDDELKRNFYTEMCRLERWNVRALRRKIGGMLYERTAIAKKPEEVARQAISELKEADKLTPDLILRDPYFLNFTGLKDNYSESDLERSILNELEKFIREFGSDFCFIERQKRMSTEKTDRYLDLLFFHRRLRKLIAIELKLDKFEPGYKGQMEWYLQWLDKNERREGEEKPLGIILCADKDQEDVEYLLLSDTGIHVAQYFTELPSKKELEEQLHKAIQIAKEKHEVI